MGKFLAGNEWQWHLARTVAQGVSGVFIANIDLIVGFGVLDPTIRALVVAFVMAVLSPAMAALGGGEEVVIPKGATTTPATEATRARQRPRRTTSSVPSSPTSTRRSRSWTGRRTHSHWAWLGPSWAKKWLDRVRDKTGVTPGIYTSRSVLFSYDRSSVAKTYPLWVAQYPNYEETGFKSEPWTDGWGLGAWKDPLIFQYTGTGRVPGYAGNLDLNLFYGSKAD